jgi:hypothetical protein
MSSLAVLIEPEKETGMRTISFKKIRELIGSSTMIDRLEKAARYIDQEFKFVSGSTGAIFQDFGGKVPVGTISVDMQSFAALRRYFLGNIEDRAALEKSLKKSSSHVLLLQKTLAKGITRWEELELGQNTEPIILPPITLKPPSASVKSLKQKGKKTNIVGNIEEVQATASAISSMETILNGIEQNKEILLKERDTLRTRAAEVTKSLESLDMEERAIKAGLEAVRRVAGLNGS